MNYQETLKYLYDRLPMFHRIGKAAYKPDLKNIAELVNFLDNPHKKFHTIHVGGTNGKGSVSHYMASILQSAGYKTGLYTSPHLKDFRERIKINGDTIPEKVVVDFIGKYSHLFDSLKPSFFEMTVALAFQYFYQEQVDIAVIEVGLGGRLDSTNIITPLLSVITNIGIDHTDLLGDSIEKIAAEKAGIIKNGIPVVIGETQEKTKNIFIEKAKTESAPIFFASEIYSAKCSGYSADGRQLFKINKNGKLYFKELKSGLLGNYQRKNLPAVLQSIDVLNDLSYSVPNDALLTGIENVINRTGLLGRWQILGHDPLIICDTGHNEDGIREVVNQVNKMIYKNLHFIFGVVSDKNVDPVLGLLPGNAQYYFCKAGIPRAMDAVTLRQKAAMHGLHGQAYPSVAEAFKTAKASAEINDLIFIGGSTFVVAEVL